VASTGFIVPETQTRLSSDRRDRSASFHGHKVHLGTTDRSNQRRSAEGDKKQTPAAV